jgi:hypothetical protein
LLIHHLSIPISSAVHHRFVFDKNHSIELFIENISIRK